MLDDLKNAYRWFKRLIEENSLETGTVINAYEESFGTSENRRFKEIKNPKSQPLFDPNLFPALFSCGNEKGIFEPQVNREWPGEMSEWHSTIFWQSAALQSQLDASPLAQVLAAFIWKQGDLQKLPILFKGLAGVGQGGVMFHFGKHLKNPMECPIVDQHTFRAMRFHQAVQKKDIDKDDLTELLNKLSAKETIDHSDCGKYVNWWTKRFKDRVEGQETMLHLDRFLFSFGKAVLVVKKSKRK